MLKLFKHYLLGLNTNFTFWMKFFLDQIAVIFALLVCKYTTNPSSLLWAVNCNVYSIPQISMSHFYLM